MGKGLQPLHDLTVAEDVALDHLFFGADKGTLDHVHDGGFVLLVEIFPGNAELGHDVDEGTGVLGGGKAADHQRCGAEFRPQRVQVGQFFGIPGGGQKAVTAVAVVAPGSGQHPGHRIAAGNDAEDVALGPAFQQGAVRGVIGIEILLQVRPVGGSQGRRHRKAVGIDVLPPQLGELPGDLCRQQICDNGAAAVAAQPELEGTALPGSGQIGLEGRKHRRHGRDKAGVRAGIAHVEVAGPLAAVAAAPQDKRHKGGALAVQGQGLAGQRVAHKVPGPAGVEVVVVEQRVPEAQGLVGGSNVGFPPHGAVDPVFRIAGYGVGRSADQTQRCQCQLVVILGGRVGEKAVGVIERVGQVAAAQVTADANGVAAIRYCASHGALPGGPDHQPGQQSAAGRKPQHLAKTSSIHNFSPQNQNGFFLSIPYPGRGYNPKFSGRQKRAGVAHTGPLCYTVVQSRSLQHSTMWWNICSTAGAMAVGRWTARPTTRSSSGSMG